MRMKRYNVFVVDDERIIRVSVADELREAGCNVFEFSNAISAIQKMRDIDVDIIFTDVRMSEMDGIEFLRKIKNYNPNIYVVIMTAYSTVSVAVESLRLGAYDFLMKPFEMELVLMIYKRIKELKSIKNDNKILRSKVEKKYDFSSFIGKSKATQEIFELIKLVINTNTTVLITGETGTGKELLSNIIHYNSERKKRPFIKVSCAILSREIFESELFGHVKGAFTGADKDKPGRFELADTGTLYLDDVDDIPLDLQVKLLRVLEEREVERVGATKAIKIDVRVIASTKVELKKLVEAGKFREDLYYRLSVFPVNIVPLRERKDDIKSLINYFVGKFAKERNIKIDAEAMKILQKYDWPGNIRELKNLAERLVILSYHDNIINVEKIPAELSLKNTRHFFSHLGEKSLVECLSNFEINAIKYALVKSNNNKSKAAIFLKIPLSTLRTKMEKYNIE